MMSRRRWLDVAGPVIVLVLIVGAMVLLRWRLLTPPGLLLGWNSDTAIYGLIAEQMLEEGRPVFLFWGQDYLGTLTSLWTIVAASVAGRVGPLALRVGALLQVAVALLVFWDLICRAWGMVAASITVLWLIAGPRWFFEMTYAPLSAEQMFFVGALILWYAGRAPFSTRRQWFVLGLLAGIGWWAHRGSLFAVVSAAAVIVAYDERWRTWRETAAAACFGVAGALVGSIPLVVGLRDVDQPLYVPLAAPWSIFRLPERIGEVFRVDAPAFVGADATAAGVIFGCVLLALTVMGLYRARTNRIAATLMGMLAVAAGFWIFSPQAYSGAPRYLMLALPVAYGLAARGAVALGRRRAWGAVCAVLACAFVTVSLYGARLVDVREIAAGRRENHYAWKSFDPRPALAELRTSNYTVCYADFWVAYKLEWLSEPRVRFIPYRSVDRTRRRSARLALQPGRKCFVSTDGRVQALSDAEEAAYRSVVLGRQKP